jgi:hypothetical protein
LLIVARIVLRVTVAPARSGSASMRPAVSADTQRICSGTRVPGARTCRSMVPCFTVSTQSVARSTDWAAGSSFDRATVTKTMAVSPAPRAM